MVTSSGSLDFVLSVDFKKKLTRENLFIFDISRYECFYKSYQFINLINLMQRVQDKKRERDKPCFFNKIKNFIFSYE